MRVDVLPRFLLSKCVAFTSLTSGTSRVWPTLVGVSLAPNTTLSIPIPDSNCLRDYRDEMFKERASRKVLFDRTRKSLLSDISWVAGGIIVVTGLFVAAFGIFPRNQVRF